MSEAKDGGPASEKSLRAELAGRALTGIIAAKANTQINRDNVKEFVHWDIELGAKLACAYADATLKELEK